MLKTLEKYASRGSSSLFTSSHKSSYISLWNRLHRGWLNHTDAVKRGIAMSTRLAEIKMEHDLNDLDFATMMEAIDDTLPVKWLLSLCCLVRPVIIQPQAIFFNPNFISFCPHSDRPPQWRLHSRDQFPGN